MEKPGFQSLEHSHEHWKNAGSTLICLHGVHAHISNRAIAWTPAFTPLLPRPHFTNVR